MAGRSLDYHKRIRLINRANLAGPEKHALLVIAEYLGNDGDAFPGQQTLAHDLSLAGPRAVRKRLARLQALGILQVHNRPGRGQTNRYTIDWEALEAHQQERPDRTTSTEQEIDSSIAVDLDSVFAVMAGLWHDHVRPSEPIPVASPLLLRRLSDRMSEPWFRSNWRAALLRIPELPYLNGQVKPNVVARLDWFLDRDNAHNILAKRKYDPWSEKAKPQSGQVRDTRKRMPRLRPEDVEPEPDNKRRSPANGQPADSAIAAEAALRVNGQARSSGPMPVPGTRAYREHRKTERRA